MQTHIFVLRLWYEAEHETGGEWRGRIAAVESGEEWAFRDPTTLYSTLLRMLDHLEATGAPARNAKGSQAPPDAPAQETGA